MTICEHVNDEQKLHWVCERAEFPLYTIRAIPEVLQLL